MFSRNVSCISITKQSHNYNFVQHFPNQVLVAPHPLIIFKHNQLIIERIIKWFLRLSKLLMMIFCESATTRLICTSIARQIFIYKCVIRLFIIRVFASYMSYVFSADSRYQKYGYMANNTCRLGHGRFAPQMLKVWRKITSDCSGRIGSTLVYS